MGIEEFLTYLEGCRAADTRKRSSRVPYWQRTRQLRFRGGLLNGRDRSEDILMYRYDALLTDSDREEWLRRERERLGLGGILEEMEQLNERLDQLEEELDRTLRRSAGSRIPYSRPIPMGDG